VPETQPRIFASEKLFAVVGADDIYQEISPTSGAFVFFEDGKFDPRSLRDVSPDSVVLVFNKKDEADLKMSFLQSRFIDMQDLASRSEWANRNSGEYLKWKYELLVNEIGTREFDYGKGVSFSTISGEEIILNLETPQEGEYYLAIRSMSRSTDNQLELDFGSKEIIPRKRFGEFEWYIKGPVTLEKGKHQLLLENINGMNVVNTVAIVSKIEWDEAERLAQELVARFDIYDLEDKVEPGKLVNLDYQQISTVRYIVTPAQVHWIVFTDNYHPKWNLKTDTELSNSFPFYSMVNGFYVNSSEDHLEIIFKGQEVAKWGFYFSALSVLLLVLIFLWFYSKRNLFSGKLRGKQ